MVHKGDDKGPQEVMKAIGERLKAYLDREWRGNQSALAAELGISQPAISRVITGEQLPSGKLTLALQEHTELDIAWLLAEQGDMLREEVPGSVKVPVADRPLPGAPADHPDLLTGDLIPGYGAVRPTQYWLRVPANAPVTRAAALKIKAGDLILLESGQDVFPDAETVYQELWVVRIKEKSEFKHRLAEVSHEEGDWFTVDTFNRVPGATPQVVKVSDLVARKVVILRR